MRTEHCNGLMVQAPKGYTQRVWILRTRSSAGHLAGRKGGSDAVAGPAEGTRSEHVGHGPGTSRGPGERLLWRSLDGYVMGGQGRNREPELIATVPTGVGVLVGVWRIFEGVRRDLTSQIAAVDAKLSARVDAVGSQLNARMTISC